MKTPSHQMSPWNWHHIALMNSIFRDLTRLDPTWPGRYGNSSATNLHQCAVASPAGSHGSLVSPQLSLNFELIRLSVWKFPTQSRLIETICNKTLSKSPILLHNRSIGSIQDPYRSMQIHWDFSFVESAKHVSVWWYAPRKSRLRQPGAWHAGAQVF
jgi:hypothetical protein